MIVTVTKLAPTVALTRRLTAIEAEIAEHNATLMSLASEAEEIKTALKVLQRYGVQVAPPAPPVAQGSQGRPHTVPAMILAIVREMAFLDGPTSQDVLDEIRNRWDAKADPNNIRPTLWRMVKDGRLTKAGDRYQLPEKNKDPASSDTESMFN